MSTTTRITYDQFDAMIRRGDFDRDDRRVELILGEILEKSPIGDPHQFAVDELTEWSFESLPRHAVRVRVQGPFGIPILHSVPQPDLAWLRREDYSKRRPLPHEILLIVEVSDSSLSYNRGVKARLYARAGIADYWLVNIPGRCLEIRRDPRRGTYRSLEILHDDQEAHPLAFPQVALPVSRLFPAT